MPDDFYCKKIEITVDKFTNETTYTADWGDNVDLIKIVKGNVKTIYLSIRTTGNKLNVGEKGLILLLENNKRIEKPTAKIDVEYNTEISKYVYSAFVKLTPEDITLLSNNELTDGRLYIYDTDLKDLSKEFQGYLKCLLK